ncbi:MAG TPA: amidohydrolase family protein, partial [Candidatus Dormibacteraeota bacterium]
EVLSELLWWVGEDRLTFASDYALWSPRWIVEKFVDFQMPEDIKEQKGVDLTIEGKRKILGLNAAKLYDLEVPADLQLAAAAPAAV